jgi:hypothetical protein
MYVKATLNATTRKFKLTENKTFEAVKAEIARCFKEASDNLSFGYVDEENEFITISSEEDWAICQDDFSAKNSGKSVPTISLQLRPASNDDFAHVTNLSQLDASEIQEEPLQKKSQEPLASEATVIEEVVPEPASGKMDQETIEEKPAPAPETEAQRDDKLSYEAISNLVTGVTEALSNFGIQVDVIEATTEPVDAPQTQRSVFEDQSISSQLSHQMKEEIESIIEEKLAKHFQTAPATQETNPAPATPANQPVHRGITCDGCKKPLAGAVRFKSLVKHDFDLCEPCEAKGIHPGPMVRFSAPVNSAPFQLENKFRQLYPIFNGSQQAEPQRGPGPHCPFRGGFGGFGPMGKKCWAGNQGQGPCKWKGFNGQHHAFMNAAKEAFKAFVNTQKNPQDATLEQITEEVKKVLPSVTSEQVKQVMEANNLKTSDEVVNFLLQ